jgi:hypothetical protein
MARKIIQIATIASMTYEDPQTRVRHITPTGTVALCDDGTLWAMCHRLDGGKVQWDRYEPIPQD